MHLKIPTITISGKNLYLNMNVFGQKTSKKVHLKMYPKILRDCLKVTIQVMQQKTIPVSRKDIHADKIVADAIFFLTKMPFKKNLTIKQC